MARLIETSLWIDLTRARSPVALKEFIAAFVDAPDACLAEPIVFELLRNATDAEARQLERVPRRRSGDGIFLLPLSPASGERAG